MNDEEISKIATEVLERSPRSAHLLEVKARSDVDGDGMPVLLVKATYDRNLPSEFESPLSGIHDIRSELILKGEDRFVFLENVYLNERDPVTEDVD